MIVREAAWAETLGEAKNLGMRLFAVSYVRCTRSLDVKTKRSTISERR